MAKKDSKKTIERTYNIPLRKEYRKVPGWKRTKKAVKALREFLIKHMKSDNVKLSPELNEKMWNHGIRNPPHHIKITVTKDAEGVVNADLFDKKVKKEDKKTVKKEIKVETKETPLEEIKSVETKEISPEKEETEEKKE